jgi:hypothetical protein
VCQHIGWGDPAENGLFFVGIEETLSWRAEDIARHSENSVQEGGLTYYAAEGNPDDRPRTKTRIPQWVSKIACRTSKSFRNHADSKAWSKYSDQRLWMKGSGVFNANLFPLGKPRTKDWPEGYKTLFDVGSKETAEYEAAVRQIRYPALRKFWTSRRPAATVAFGKRYWPKFESAFDLNGFNSLSSDGRLKFYPDKRFILAPFFGYWHMSDAVVESICTQLDRWNVSIP